MSLLKHILPNIKSYPFSDICATKFFVLFNLFHLNFLVCHQNVSFLQNHQYQLLVAIIFCFNHDQQFSF